MGDECSVPKTLFSTAEGGTGTGIMSGECQTSIPTMHLLIEREMRQDPMSGQCSQVTRFLLFQNIHSTHL